MMVKLMGRIHSLCAKKTTAPAKKYIRASRLVGVLLIILSNIHAI
ncbi:hypothetical protein WH240_15500 [Gluconobacter wancherniae]